MPDNTSNSTNKIILLAAVTVISIAAVITTGALVLNKSWDATGNVTGAVENIRETSEADDRSHDDSEVEGTTEVSSDQGTHVLNSEIEQQPDAETSVDKDAFDDNGEATSEYDDEIEDEEAHGEEEISEAGSADETGAEGEYILPDSSSKRLKMADLDGLSADDCRLARNEIYARHGRKFSDEELQKYFNSKSWYHGKIDPEDFDEDLLSEIEIANRDLIVDSEKKKGYR